MSTQYSYLNQLTKTECRALLGLLRKYGVKGFLTLGVEMSQFKMNQNDCPAPDKARAERIARELSALIERLEGFEELIKGGK